MKLILLSGGSGKRLWPLSNDARSKQFLHLLSSPSGEKESMIERVVRQARSYLTDDILVATNATQRDSIVNQVGDAVQVITEPERHDTFPAIALAAAHIKLEQGCNDNEVVVVMPCDVYTERSYYSVIKQMTKAVEDNKASLVLMGIKPTKPSEQFGYVIPKCNDKEASVLQVSRFVEKPNEPLAQQLLKEGAYWNGGVFAFRLGYLLQYVEKYIQPTDYDQFYNAFNQLPARSFDYEVAENASSVAMVPFDGRWKDLGSWRELCEEIPSTHSGNVLMGKYTLNTHVINELGIPIFCDGVSNTVVAASPDGILVCEKSLSEQINQYSDQLVNRPMYEERRWGTYRVLDSESYATGMQSLTKSIILKPGKNISYQVHHHRTEVWTIADGEGWFVLDGEVRAVKTGDVLHIPVEHFHAIKAKTQLTFIEVQLGNPLIEEDIDRYYFDWNV